MVASSTDCRVTKREEVTFMRPRVFSIAAAMMLAITGVAVVGSASPAYAHCSGHGTHPDLYSGGGISWGDGTAIRSHPHIDCDPPLGRGYPGQGIDVHCAVHTGADWVYARNTSTGINGWSREDALNVPNPVFVPVCNSLAATMQLG
jgi:hypothetical protein